MKNDKIPYLDVIKKIGENGPDPCKAIIVADEDGSIDLDLIHEIFDAEKREKLIAIGSDRESLFAILRAYDAYYVATRNGGEKKTKAATSFAGLLEDLAIEQDCYT